MLSDDIADNEPLMAAIGKIALRSAELGEIFDSIASRLDQAASKKCRKSMLGFKVGLVRKVVEHAPVLSGYPRLTQQFIEFCDDVDAILHERNSPIRSTFIQDDDSDDSFVKWDNRHDPELVRIDDLNESARKFEGTLPSISSGNCRLRRA